jgi:hypothetical protein
VKKPTAPEEPQDEPEQAQPVNRLDAARSIKTHMGVELGTMNAGQLKAVVNSKNAFTQEIRDAAALILASMNE